MTERLEFQEVRREYSGGAGVHRVDLIVVPGEVHALVGLNGAGKTTLLRLALGLLRADSGAIRVLGEPVATMKRPRWAEVGAMIEHPFAYPELSLRTNLELAARLRLVPSAAIPPMIEEVIAELDLGRYERIRSGRLSLGNRQRLGLAAALQHHPRLIILDEPTNALDPQGIVLCRDALRRRADAGAGVLVSSHHLDEVARIADRITVLNEGVVIGSLDPDGVDLERTFFRLVHSATEVS